MDTKTTTTHTPLTAAGDEEIIHASTVELASESEHVVVGVPGEGVPVVVRKRSTCCCCTCSRTKCALLTVGILLFVGAGFVALFLGILNQPKLNVNGKVPVIGFPNATNSIRVNIRSANVYETTWSDFDVHLWVRRNSKHKVGRFTRGRGIDAVHDEPTRLSLHAKSLEEYGVDQLRGACQLYGSAEVKVKGTVEGKVKDGAPPRKRHVISRWKYLDCVDAWDTVTAEDASLRF